MAVVNALEYLDFLIVTMDIDLRYEDLRSGNPNHLGYAWPARKIISLDRSIRGTWQGKCVLAHEFGHFQCTPLADHKLYHSAEFYTLDAWNRTNLWAKIVKEERGAMRWGTDALISDPLFWDYVRTDPHPLWEWCEHFEVEPWFMVAKMGFIRVKEHEMRRRTPKMREFILRVG